MSRRGHVRTHIQYVRLLVHHHSEAIFSFSTDSASTVHGRNLVVATAREGWKGLVRLSYDDTQLSRQQTTVLEMENVQVNTLHSSTKEPSSQSERETHLVCPGPRVARRKNPSKV